MQIVLSNQARKFLDKLHERKPREKIFQAIEYLGLDPVPYKEFDLEKMGGMENAYRLRKGDFRIVYAFDKDKDTVHIIEITRREQAYK